MPHDIILWLQRLILAATDEPLLSSTTLPYLEAIEVTFRGKTFRITVTAI